MAGLPKSTDCALTPIGEPTLSRPWLNEPMIAGPQGTRNLARATVQRRACTPAGTRRPSAQRIAAVRRTSTVPCSSDVHTSEPSAAVMSSIISERHSSVIATLQLLLDPAQVLLGERLVLDELQDQLVGPAVEDRADELAQALAARRRFVE